MGDQEAIVQRTEAERAELESALAGLQARIDQEKAEKETVQKALEALQDLEREGGAEPDRVADAFAHIEQGDTAAAEAIFAEVEAAETAKGAEHTKRAADMAKQIGALAFLHDTEKAVNAYERATTLNPDDPDAWNRLGHLRHRLGQLDSSTWRNGPIAGWRA